MNLLAGLVVCWFMLADYLWWANKPWFTACHYLWCEWPILSYQYSVTGYDFENLYRMGCTSQDEMTPAHRPHRPRALNYLEEAEGSEAA